MLSTMTQTLSRHQSPNLLRTTVLRGPFLKHFQRFSTAAVTSDDSIFPRWKTPVVTSHGDYAEEAWLEDYIGGPLYAHQKELPRLPVPAIKDTLDRLLPTALPLAKTQHEKDTLHEAVTNFPMQAKELQERLLERQADNQNSSWLQHWWNTAGYLQVRDPSVINVSYFFHFADDPACTTNTKRGAALLHATAKYRALVCSGQLPADKIGKHQTPLCSVAYKYMFHACRIPQLKQDTYAIHDPSLHNHVIVARKGHFFCMTFANSKGEPYSLQALEEGLQNCIDQADEMGDYPQLGWLTSMDRDDWANARTILLQNGGDKMKEALFKLESGAVMLNLDDEEPVSRAETAELFWHGGLKEGANRWYDKSIQIICANNGRAGFVGEHSMMDGMPCVGLADHMTKLTYDKCAANDTASSDRCDVTSIFKDVFEEMGKGAVEPLLEKGKADFSELITKHALNVQSFQGYGADFMKQAGHSPDAYLQMAMQLATYRLWGEQGGTYEATQVRPFLHGRTETTRTVSPESAAFVNAMGLRPKADELDASARKNKLALLQDATTAHVKYIGLAAKAQGVDRHLLGLSMLVGPGEKAPDLYSHPVFVRAKTWRVSTSHLTHPKLDGWGYGEVVPNGVGLAYSIHKRHCAFNITALKEHGWTDKLCELLQEALLEMRTLVEMENASQPASKL